MEARARLVPETLKVKPSDNYDDLKRQFFALKSLYESKSKECSIYSNRLAEYGRESVIARSEALESEKEMNAQLTLELEKANERVNKWISVKDALPRSCLSQNYMAYRPNAPVESKVSTLWYDPVHNGWSGKYRVTHWMPLPAPPEDQE